MRAWSQGAPCGRFAQAFVVVSVSSEELLVRPTVLSGLLALPSTLDLDHRIPLARIKSARSGTLKRSHTVVLEFADDGREGSISFLCRGDACGRLAETLRGLGVPVDGLSAQPPRSTGGPSTSAPSATRYVVPVLFWVTCTIAGSAVLFPTMTTGIYAAVSGLAVTVVECWAATRASSRESLSATGMVAAISTLPGALLGWVFLFGWEGRVPLILAGMLACQCAVAWAFGLRRGGVHADASQARNCRSVDDSQPEEHP
jgi:hypothetical protein